MSDRLYSCRWCWLWISVSFVALLCLVVTDRWRFRRTLMPRLCVSSDDDVYVVKKNELRWLANATRQITTHANPKIKPLTIIGRWCASIIICTFVSGCKVLYQKFLKGILSSQSFYWYLLLKILQRSLHLFFSLHDNRLYITQFDLLLHTLISLLTVYAAVIDGTSSARLLCLRAKSNPIWGTVTQNDLGGPPGGWAPDMYVKSSTTLLLSSTPIIW